MFKFLKDKTLGKINRWLSRQIVRFFSDLKHEHLKELSKSVPEELKEYHRLELLLNNNGKGLHNLYKEAKDSGKFAEAFLYFFYEFEIILKHMIMSEMMFQNHLEQIKGKKFEEFFIKYPKNKVEGFQKNGHIDSLIKTFVSLYGDEIKSDLVNIKEARNFIIHNMLKEEMNETQIKNSFEYFFTATNPTIKKAYMYFDKILEERPKRLSEEFQFKVEQSS